MLQLASSKLNHVFVAPVEILTFDKPTTKTAWRCLISALQVDDDRVWRLFYLSRLRGEEIWQAEFVRLGAISSPPPPDGRETVVSRRHPARMAPLAGREGCLVLLAFFLIGVDIKKERSCFRESGRRERISPSHGLLRG